MSNFILDAKHFIKNANDNIEKNIEVLCPKYAGLCAQNILSQSRNLLDGFALLKYRQDVPDGNFDNGGSAINAARSHLKNSGPLFKAFATLYKHLEVISSHYTQNLYDSESLLIRYRELLYEIRDIAKSAFGFEILKNLNDFPFDDKKELNYYSLIKSIIEQVEYKKEEKENTYYIEKKTRRPFGVFEYVLSPANDKRSKFDRLTAFSLKNIKETHAIRCQFVKKTIEHNGISIVIAVISGWAISIRPCELNKLAFIQGIDLKINRSSDGYSFLMQYLQTNNYTLYDLVSLENLPDELERNGISLTYPIAKFLIKTRINIFSNDVGSKTLRYLLFTCRHEIIKRQIALDNDRCLGSTFLDKGCYAFDCHPFSFSLKNHNPKLSTLLECMPEFCTTEELLKRAIITNTEDRKQLYTPISNLDKVFHTKEAASIFNESLGERLKSSSILFHDDRYAFIKAYEDHTVSILRELKRISKVSDSRYQKRSKEYIKCLKKDEIDKTKIEILNNGFSNTSLLLINGAAGTGKTTILRHFSNLLDDEKILFLSCTNSSIQNLRIKIKNGTSRQNKDFMTIEKYNKRKQYRDFSEYKILIVDECSMVSNEDFDRVLNDHHFSKMILVGDERQIESIKFGNWFGIANRLFDCSFELPLNHRTKEQNLITIWDLVRTLSDKDLLVEKLISTEFHHELNQSLFDSLSSDEVILCLNYDGLYGINNINKYLQNKNNNKPVSWKVWTFKVGDKILFNESYYFRDYFYNNQKGIIEEINESSSFVNFVVSVSHEETNIRDYRTHVSWLREVDGRDYYSITIDKDDDDDEDETAKKVIVVPFQLGYAISIHKSQGLEFESVKVVLTKEVEEQISHNVFYTAITRSKKYLKLFCEISSLSNIISSLEIQSYDKDTALIKHYFPDLVL